MYWWDKGGGGVIESSILIVMCIGGSGMESSAHWGRGVMERVV